MEFRRYNKINCSLFDLIDGDIEVKQTMALGYLFSQSESSLKSFLKLANIPCPNYDKYIIDCEGQGVNGRIDILIRFYKNFKPIKAIIVEAKSISSTTASLSAAKQVAKYTSFSQLNVFNNNIDCVTLTRDAQPVNGAISISWSQLISELYSLANKHKQKSSNHLINSFIKFITNIEGSMKYYEEEILSIPAKATGNAVINTGIYECPINYNKKKKSLYITVRAKGGEMDTLFKLKEKFELDLNDNSAIIAINQNYPDFQTRITKYKSQTNYNVNNHDIKQVFFFDLDNPIKLPISVRPMENNVGISYYSLHDFIQKTKNSNLGSIIVQKNIWIDNDILNIEPGKKVYTLKDHSTSTNLKTIKDNKDSYPLDPNKKYIIEVNGNKKNVALNTIEIQKNNGQWNMFFNY